MTVIILDRDGVINVDNAEYVKNADEWEPMPGSLEAIAELTRSGYTVVVCTNQSGLGRGLYTMEDLNKMHEKMHKLVEQEGGKIAAVFFCPHKPTDNCACRKPKPAMIEDIIVRFNIDDISKLMFVGDSLRDLEAISNLGGIPVLVKTGNGKKTLAHGQLPPNTMIFKNLLALSNHLVEVREKNALT